MFEHTNYNLLGRHVVDWSYNRRNVNGQKHSNPPSSTSRICAEFKEITVDTNAENRVFRGDTRFINHGPVSLSLPEKKVSRTRAKSRTKAVSRTSSENTSINFRINQTNRFVVFD